MGSVDLTGVTPGLFIVNAVFIMLIFSMFSMAILRFFQQRIRPVLWYGVFGVFFIIVFAVIVNTWFI